MKASPEDQLRLLDLQSLDTALDRLNHRRRTLPEHEQIETLETELATFEDRIVVAKTEDSDLGQEQAKLETDIDVVRGRMVRDQQRLDSGAISSPKELESLAAEVTSLKRRQNELEDAELELMEQRAEIDETVTALEAERSTLTVQCDAAIAQRDSTLAAIAEDEVATVSARKDISAAIAEDLMALYDKLRASSAGIGAAALYRGQCQGCHLTLNTTDLKAMREADDDEVQRCDECRRILVRTAESGL